MLSWLLMFRIAGGNLLRGVKGRRGPPGCETMFLQRALLGDLQLESQVETALCLLAGATSMARTCTREASVLKLELQQLSTWCQHAGRRQFDKVP